MNERNRELQLVVDSVPVMITRLDRDERFLFANRAYTEMVELPAEDLLGRRVADVVSPETYARIKPALNRALSGDPVSVDRIQRRANGERIEIEGRYIPDVDVEGRVIGMFAVHRDVTAERRARESLAKSEGRFRGLASLSSDWYWEQDAQFRYVYISEDADARGAMGMKARAGKTRWELPWTGVTEAQWAAHRAKLDAHQVFHDFEIGRPGADGETTWVSVSGEPIFDAEGRFTGYRGVTRNITKRKLTEQSLRSSEVRFRQTFELAASGIAHVDLQGCFTRVNRSLCRILGRSATELVGRTVREFSHPEDREVTDAARQRMRDGDIESEHFEKRYLHEDGSIVWVDLTVALVRDAGGKPEYEIAVFDDITEGVLARGRIERMNTELEERVETRTAELRAAMQELDAFTYSVSHDLRAPIGAVSGFAHLLRSAETARLSEDGRRLLGFIEHNAERMTRLIEGLLRFSRLGRSELRRSRVSMNGLVGESLMDFVDEVARASISAAAMPDCNGDPALLSQVWANLVGNALKYSRGASPPRVDVGWDAERNAYYVRDNGIGFDMAYAGKLFGVFERLHAESEYEGSGIGLAIAERIVRLHGGAIWADAAPGRGATFWFTVPAAEKWEN